MDSGSWILIAVLAVLVAMSAYFSATETAFSSLNKIRIKNLAQTNRRAALAMEIANHYDKMLSTILIGNNIVNICAASLATVIFVKYFDDMGVTLSTVVMTIVVLIFGEISPKSIAKEMPERFAMFSAPILRVLLVILTPVNFLFVQWKKLLSKMFRFHREDGITGEELMTMVDEAQEGGGIDEQEGELLRNALEFNGLQAVDIFTPRVDLEAIPEDCSKQEIERLFTETGFSRLPVYRDSIDNIIGIIHLKDYYNHVAYANAGIDTVIHPALYVTPTTKIPALLKLLQDNQSHMAILTDEFGGTVGIVTLEDIVEELVGEIWDEHDEVVEEIKQVAENEYRILCTADLEDMFEHFGIEAEEDECSTVGGWVTEQMGRIPKPEDSFRSGCLNVTVTRADARHVLEVRVRVQKQPEQDIFNSNTVEACARS